MNLREFTQSIRFGMVIAILLMGAFGLSVAMLTSERYKWLIDQNDQRVLTELLGHEVQADLQKHHRLQVLLSQNLQKRSDFRDAVRRGDADRLQAILDEQFRQYLVTTGKLDLRQLRVFGTDFRVLSESSTTPPPHAGQPACQEVVSRAARRKGNDRFKLINALCEHDQQILATTIVPVGGIRPFAYLMIIASPVANLVGVSNELQSPLEFLLPNGQVAHRAGDWTQPNLVLQWPASQHIVLTPSGNTAFSVRVFKDGAYLVERLASTRLTLTISTIALTALAMVLAFLVLHRTLFKPLSELTGTLRRITNDRNHLGDPLPLTGSSEIKQLATSFNDMSAELARLYRQLEKMAFSDPLTQLPNRSWFHDSLERLASLTQRGAPGFALLFLDLDKFKAINDNQGHQVGDEVLKLISVRIVGILRSGDYLARFDHEASDALARMGGDEFAVLLPSTRTRTDAERVAQKIITAVERPIHLQGLNLQLGISIGIALYPGDAPDTRTLIHRADLAMYHAKTRGGGFTCYSAALEKAGTGT